MHPAAPVEVTWCGLYLPQFNSEETKQKKSTLNIIINISIQISAAALQYNISRPE